MAERVATGLSATEIELQPFGRQMLATADLVAGGVTAAGGKAMIGRLQCVVLDCPDASGLARFYQSLLGGA